MSSDFGMDPVSSEKQTIYARFQGRTSLNYISNFYFFLSHMDEKCYSEKNG